MKGPRNLVLTGHLTGHFSDAVQICTMFDSWMKFRITNRVSQNKVCRQFGAAHGVHAFRLAQLGSTVSLIGDWRQSQVAKYKLSYKLCVAYIIDRTSF